MKFAVGDLVRNREYGWLYLVLGIKDANGVLDFKGMLLDSGFQYDFKKDKNDENFEGFFEIL